MSDFTAAFKSTIDKIGNDLAVAEGVKLVDMDDVARSQTLLESSINALVWEFLTLDPSPVDPLYAFSFHIGARTVADSANYNILKLLDAIKAAFPERSSLEIRDYTGAAAGPVVGNLYISSIGVDPQMFDKASGIRYALVTGRCVRDG